MIGGSKIAWTRLTAECNLSTKPNTCKRSCNHFCGYTWCLCINYQISMAYTWNMHEHLLRWMISITNAGMILFWFWTDLFFFFLPNRLLFLIIEIWWEKSEAVCDWGTPAQTLHSMTTFQFFYPRYSIFPAYENIQVIKQACSVKVLSYLHTVRVHNTDRCRMAV